jgi:UDP-2,3-diacylglucosamine hydrolase
LFIVGDLFDFWYEYKKVVPRGYVRMLGKLAEFTDSGIPVHFLWATTTCGCGTIFRKN